MEERHGYQNNESYGGQNPGEMREGQEGMYGQGPSGGEAVPAERIGNKPKWVIGRTVLGILSIILFIFVAMQSCAAGLGNALSDNGEVGGSAGALCALNLLVAGLIVLVARKTVKKAPMIVAAVLMFLNLFYGMILAGSYADLQIWGVLSFIFGLVYLFSVLRKKKQWIIAGIISAVFFALVMAMGSASSGSSGTGNSGSGEAPAETSQASADNGGKAVAGTGIDKEQTMNTGSVSETGAVQEQTGQGAGLQEAEQTRQQGAPAGQNAGAAWEVGQGRVLTYTDSINTTWAQVSVPVTNTGDRNLYLSSGTMDLEDAGGHLVDSLSLVGFYPQVLAPGETGWYYEETTLDSVPSSELTVVPHVDIKEATVECIRYEASDLSFADEEFGGIKATGRITNTTAADGSLVYVVLFLFDSEEKLVGQTFTILDGELKAGDTIGFSTQTFGSNDTINVDTITGYRLFAYPEQFQF